MKYGKGCVCVPVHHPFEAGVCARCLSGYGAAAAGGDVAFDVEVGEEGGVDVGAWGSAAAEVHRVRAVETHAVGFGLNVTGVLDSLELDEWGLCCITYHVPVERVVIAAVIAVDVAVEG